MNKDIYSYKIEIQYRKRKIERTKQTIRNHELAIESLELRIIRYKKELPTLRARLEREQNTLAKLQL